MIIYNMRLTRSHYLGLGGLLLLVAIYFSVAQSRRLVEGNTSNGSNGDASKATIAALNGLKKTYTDAIKKELLSYSTETTLANGLSKIQKALDLLDTINTSLKLLGSSGSSSPGLGALSSSSGGSGGSGGGGHLGWL